MVDQTTSYSFVRSKIRSGYILGIKGHNFMAKVTTLTQRLSGFTDTCDITHMGVAWWLCGRLYCIEMDGLHNILRPLSQHVLSGMEVNVYKSPVSYTALKEQFDFATQQPIPYSYPDLLKIGIAMIFRRVGPKEVGGLVCSTFVHKWLLQSGWVPPNGFPNMPGPARLCNELGQPLFAVTGV